MKKEETYLQRKLNFFINLENLALLSPFIWLMVGVFNIPDGKSVLSKLIIILAIYCLIRFRGEYKINLNNPTFKALSLFNIIIFSYIGLQNIFNDESFRFARTLFYTQVYLTVLPWHRINFRLISFIITVGAMFVGIGAIYETSVLQLTRAGYNAVNPIPYANYAAILCITCMYFLFIFKNRILLKIFYFLGILSSLTAILLSGTRGVWISSIIILAVLIIEVLKITTKKNILTSLIIILIVISGGAFTASDIIIKRYQETNLEFNKIANENMNSSIGIRLQLWERGLSYIKENPILGTGTKKYLDQIEEDKKVGLITPVAAPLARDHFHNQFIDTLVRTGFIGLALLIVWIFLPVWLHNRDKKYLLRNWAMASGIIMLIGGLTDVPFLHAQIVYFYSMLMGITLLTNKGATFR